MNIRSKQSDRVRRPSRDAIAVAVATIIAGAGSTAFAAAAPADDLEEVVVTGIRASIENSIAAKRASDQIIEAVSAEDIGKLPDTSIADSIARLPGLAAQRIDGRPAAISIRGLGPDYAGALLNGRQVVSSSDGRSAEYDQFPSELVNQVLVYKTADAGLVGQGLSGTIDIKPLMPLSLNKRQVAVGARSERNSNGGLSSTGKGASGNRFSASYVDQFADNTIGLALGFAHLDSPGQQKHYEAWDYGDYDGQWGGNATGVPSLTTPGSNCLVGAARPNPAPPAPAFSQQCAVFTQGFEASVTSSKQVRDGAMAVLEIKPNDHFSSVLDLYYSKFAQDRVGHHWVTDIGLWAGPNAAFSNVGTSNISGNTVITSGTVANGHSLVYDKNFNRTDKIFSAGWRNEIDFGNAWKAAADIGFSDSERSEFYVQSVALGAGTGSYTFSNLADMSKTSWSTPQDFTSPSVVQLTNNPDWAEMRTPKYHDQIKSARLSATHTFALGFFSGLDFGLAVNQRDKTVASSAYRLTLTNPGTTGLVAIPAGALRAPVQINVAGINQSVLSWDVPSIMGLYTAVPKDPWTAKDNMYGVHENIMTGYFKLDVNGQLGSVEVKGNLGVQVVHSEQNSDGFAWNDGGTPGFAGNGKVIPVSGGATYNDVLPSLNLSFKLQPDLVLRAGIAKAMARPRMDDMRAGTDQAQLTALLPAPSTDPLQKDPGQWKANNGGKPDLQPWRAKAYDLSLEKYFGKRSYVAVAGFLKQLDSFIYQRSTVRDFTGFPNYSLKLIPGCAPTSPGCNPNLGLITTMDNGSGGRVYGVEYSASLDGSLITQSLDGLGLIASYSTTHNKLPLDNNHNPINLDGFSGSVNSIAAYFERAGFSARVSQRYRSAFTATTRSVLLSTENSTHIDAERQVDAQLGYAFETGALKGLSLLAQANNLTNQPAIQRRSAQTVGSAGSSTGLLPWKYDDYGRVLLLGVSYKL
jgi:iron complex outermembrane receptor protein